VIAGHDHGEAVGADRGVILLADDKGELTPRHVKTKSGKSDPNIVLSKTVMAEVMNLLEPVFAAKLPEHLVDREAVFWTFVIKPVGPDGELSLDAEDSDQPFLFDFPPNETRH
jgi:hypothetical protein